MCAIQPLPSKPERRETNREASFFFLIHGFPPAGQTRPGESLEEGRAMRPLWTRGLVQTARPWLMAVLVSHMVTQSSGFAHLPISHRRGGVAPRPASAARRRGLPTLPVLRRGITSLVRPLASEIAALRGMHRASRREISMAAVYCGEVTFKTMDVQAEFFVAKTLGSIALPGSVFHCTTDPPESGGKGALSHFKFDFECEGSVEDARGFLDQKFPGPAATGAAQPEGTLAPPEVILVNPAVLTYCAELTFKALSDSQEVFIASQLQSFALPNRTFVSFDDAPQAAEGASATFQFQFEIGGTLDDAHKLVDEKFPSAVDR